MKDTLHYIVASIVEKSEDVVIDEQDDNGSVNFIITVSPEDMGKVIGKEGKVIRSIRNVMKIKAMKQNKRINIQLSDTPQQ